MDTPTSSSELRANVWSLSHSKLSDMDGRRPNDLQEAIEMVPATTAHASSLNIQINGPTQTVSQQHLETIQFLTLCWALFLAGWNDGSAGPLIPRLQAVYHVGFTVISLLFVLAAVGFMAGAFVNMLLTDRVGFGKLIVLGSCLQVTAYIIQSCAPPFPLYLISFAINGTGMAMQDAQANGYVSTFPHKAETRMGLLHAAYGAGALCSPLVATHFSEAKHWEFYYLTLLGIAIVNTVTLAAVFRFRSHDDCLADIGQSPIARDDSNAQGKLRQILSMKSVHLLAAFIFVYVGVEVTTGGWIVTFIIDVRKGGTSSGYISSGFFGGLMFGRVALLWVNKKLGEQRALYLYAMIATGLEFVIWFVPSLIGNAIAVSFIGVLLGPMFPIAMNVAGRILPHHVVTGSIGWIGGLGAVGSAVVPFATGAVAGRVGIKSLQPLLLGMMVFMLILWAFVPHKRPRSD